jgi:hypothetical protein
MVKSAGGEAAFFSEHGPHFTVSGVAATDSSGNAVTATAVDATAVAARARDKVLCIEVMHPPHRPSPSPDRA